MPKLQKITSANRAQMMLEAPLTQIIPRLAIPTIISMLITAVYSMADTYFVSQISTEASAAVGVVFSAMSIFQAVAFMIGMGSGTNLSRALGRGDTESTKTYVACGFFITLILGTGILIAGHLNIHGLVRFLGATPEIEPDAIAYATYIFYAAPFMMCSFAMNNLLRFQGMAMYSMVGISTGGILNIFLDPLFIFGFGLGTAGAAIATAISQLVSFLILLFMCNTRENTISISLSAFKPTPRVIGSILYNGVPSLGRQGIASVATILINRMAATISADPAVVSAAIASISIVNRFVMFINSAVIGFGQGFQPVCAINYGAKKYDRIKTAFKYALITVSVFLVVSVIVLIIAGETLCGKFTQDAEVIAMAVRLIRAHCMVLPFMGFYILCGMFLQNIGRFGEATLVTISENGLFLIPSVLILPGIFGIDGFVFCRPAASIAALCLSLVIGIRAWKKYL